jgi:predicted SnoaL-like aldol condensation-catalyzing enzyme
MRRFIPMLATGLLLGSAALHAQDAVTAHPNPESLFTSTDPKLHANKQVAYKIVKELLESGHWDRAPQYITPRYIQHNPLAASGLDAVMKYFIDVAKATPKPIPEKMQTKVVSVLAEGRPGGRHVRARAEESGRPVENLHHHLVRYVAVQGWQGG